MNPIPRYAKNSTTSLFRCFANFIYNDHRKHKYIQHKIILNVKKHWTKYYKIIQNNNVYPKSTTDALTYEKLIKSNFFGHEVEILSFCDIYKAYVCLTNSGNNKQLSFGNDKSNNILNLTQTESDDGKCYYDVIMNDTKFQKIKKNRKTVNFEHHLRNKNLINKNRKRSLMSPTKLENERRKFRVGHKDCERKRLKYNLNEVAKHRKRNLNRKCNMTAEALQKKRESNRVKKMKNNADNITINKGQFLKSKNRLNKRNLNQRSYKRFKHKNSKDITYLHIGSMTSECSYCGALYYEQEKCRKICCNGGNVRLPPLSPYDERLKNLLLHDNKFRTLIRYYNSFFSFVSFKANFVKYNRKECII